MVDNMYSIKEASKMLDCSTQNIYRQKEHLIAKGLIEKSNTGSYYLNENGINYLREKRIETMKSNSQVLTSVDNQDFKTPCNITEQAITEENSKYITMMEEQIQELKKEKEYWKNEFMKKDDELKAKNEYIQGINIKVFSLLGTEEDNKKYEEEHKKEKKGFFHRLFS